MIKYNTIMTSNGPAFLPQMASMIAHTMIAAMTPILLTSLPETAHHVDGVVDAPVTFGCVEVVSHS